MAQAVQWYVYDPRKSPASCSERACPRALSGGGAVFARLSRRSQYTFPRSADNRLYTPGCSIDIVLV